MYAMYAITTQIVEEDTIRLQSVVQNENQYVYCSFNTLTTRWVVQEPLCMLDVPISVHVCIFACVIYEQI